MNKKSIEESVQKIVDEIMHGTDFELVDIEYVKEGPFKYLRVFIDKTGGITVDDTADVSRLLNKKLDDVDLIAHLTGRARRFCRQNFYFCDAGQIVGVLVILTDADEAFFDRTVENVFSFELCL